MALPLSAPLSLKNILLPSISEICISEGQDSDWSLVRTGGQNSKCIHRALGRADTETSRASGTEELLLRESLNSVDWNHGQRSHRLGLSFLTFVVGVCHAPLDLGTMLPSPTAFLGTLNVPQLSHVYLSLRYLG